MNDVEKLLALEEIRTLKARYWRFMDTKDWDALRGVFSDDAAIDMTAANESAGKAAGGAQAVVDYIRDIVNDVQTVHQGHTSEIDFVSDTEATGIWPMMDMLKWPEGSSRYGITVMNGWGHYHDRYKLTPDGWRISFTSVTRLRVDTDAE